MPKVQHLTNAEASLMPAASHTLGPHRPQAGSYTGSQAQAFTAGFAPTPASPVFPDTGVGSVSTFVVQYAPTGTAVPVAVAITAGGGTATPTDIVATSDGGFAVVGLATGGLPLTASAALGSGAAGIIKPVSLVGPPLLQAFVAKYGPGGVPQWIATANVASSAFGVAPDAVTVTQEQSGSILVSVGTSTGQPATSIAVSQGTSNAVIEIAAAASSYVLQFNAATGALLAQPPARINSAAPGRNFVYALASTQASRGAILSGRYVNGETTVTGSDGGSLPALAAATEAQPDFMFVRLAAGSVNPAVAASAATGPYAPPGELHSFHCVVDAHNTWLHDVAFFA